MTARHHAQIDPGAAQAVRALTARRRQGWEPFRYLVDPAGDRSSFMLLRIRIGARYYWSAVSLADGTPWDVRPAPDGCWLLPDYDEDSAVFGASGRCIGGLDAMPARMWSAEDWPDYEDPRIAEAEADAAGGGQ